jgi:hypothetical protein
MPRKCRLRVTPLVDLTPMVGALLDCDGYSQVAVDSVAAKGAATGPLSERLLATLVELGCNWQ